MKDSQLQIKLVNQALAAAQASIELAKSLLADFSGDKLPATALSSNSKSPVVDAASLPGIVGTYDGENMVTPSGEKFSVPPNYASKSLLIYGDKLKMIDGDASALGGEKRKLFKAIEKAARQSVVGILSKKDEQWLLVTSDGAHKVLEAAVNYFGFKEGDHLTGFLPQDNLKAPFAALEGKEKSVMDIKETVTVNAEKKDLESVKSDKPDKPKRAARKSKVNQAE